MVTSSKPVGRGRNGDEDIVGKVSGLRIALVGDRTFQSIILMQIISSFITKRAEESNSSSKGTSCLHFLLELPKIMPKDHIQAVMTQGPRDPLSRTQVIVFVPQPPVWW